MQTHMHVCSTKPNILIGCTNDKIIMKFIVFDQGHYIRSYIFTWFALKILLHVSHYESHENIHSRIAMLTLGFFKVFFFNFK